MQIKKKNKKKIEILHLLFNRRNWEYSSGAEDLETQYIKFYSNLSDSDKQMIGVLKLR